MRSAILFIAAIAGAAGAQAADAPQGWGPFRFGMTLAEAKSAGGSNAVLNSGGVLEYPAEIAKRQFKAFVRFTGAGGKIKDIMLRDMSAQTIATRDECQREFTKTEQGLISRYGKPKEHGTEPLGMLTVTFQVTKSLWSFPNDTTITADWIFSEKNNAFVQGCRIEIRYTPPQTVPKATF